MTHPASDTFRDRIRQKLGKLVHSPAGKLVLFGINSPSDTDEEEPQPVAAPPAEEPVDLFAVLAQYAANPEHFTHDFTLSELSQETGIPMRMLQNHFQLDRMEDFRVWKVKARIELAKERLLADDEVPILEIARQLGFQDKSNFYRRFHEITGYTPGAWRKRQDLDEEKTDSYSRER